VTAPPVAARTVPGAELAPRLAAWYDVAGAADAPTIVFVHGTRLNRVAWEVLAPHLLDDYRCVALDLPGHGAGDLPWSTLEDAADHVAAIAAEAAPGERPLLLGLSLGGYVAIQAAARHPDAFRGLVLVGCSMDPVGWRGWLFRIYAGILRYTPLPVLRAVSDTLLRLAYGRDLTARLRAHGEALVGAPAAVDSLVGHRFSDALRCYDGPVLVLNGAADVVFRAGARRWIGDRPRTDRAVIARAGHISNLDQPEAFARILRGFARRVDRATPDGSGPV
jgi:pimeloyl-ACP methyl ester carboxylesterase